MGRKPGIGRRRQELVFAFDPRPSTLDKFGMFRFNWPRLMRRFLSISRLILLGAFLSLSASAEEQHIEVLSLNQVIPGMTQTGVLVMVGTHTVIVTNGVFARYGDAVLMADAATVDMDTGEAITDGHVHVEQAG